MKTKLTIIASSLALAAFAFLPASVNANQQPLASGCCAAQAACCAAQAACYASAVKKKEEKKAEAKTDTSSCCVPGAACCLAGGAC